QQTDQIVLGADPVVCSAGGFGDPPLRSFNAFGEIGEGLVVLTQMVPVDCSPPNPEPHVLRIQFNAFGEVGDGLVPLPQRQVQMAAVFHPPCLPRVEFNGFGNVGDGLVVLQTLLVGSCPRLPEPCVERLQLDGLGIVC